MEPLRLAYTGGLADARHNANKESGGKNIRRWPELTKTKTEGGGEEEEKMNGLMMG